MKLLEKRAINTARATERKQEIDSGLALARKVDVLREARTTEEENLKKYRETALAQVQYEINQFIETKNNLEKQCEEVRDLRNELLKPLDEEWLKVSLIKDNINTESKKLVEKKSNLELQEGRIKKESQRVYDIRVRLQHKEKEKNKTLNETIKLKEMALSEYEIAKRQYGEQTLAQSGKMSDLQRLQESYEVGIKTNETQAQILKEKESDLIIREKELERQQRLLKLTKQVLEKNGNTSSTNITN